MEPSSSLLIFMEPKLGVPFALMLLLGLNLVAGWRLLRAWPPRLSRVLILVAVLLFCAVAAGALLRERWVQIDFEREMITQRAQILGLGQQQTWTFPQITAVVVRAQHEPVQKPGPRPDAVPRSDQEFGLGLQTADGWLALRDFDQAIAAEQQARVLAERMGRLARRRGYRLETAARGGDAQAFETTAGQTGVGISLESLLRVVDAPQEESAIAP